MRRPTCATSLAEGGCRTFRPTYMLDSMAAWSIDAFSEACQTILHCF